MNILQLQKGGLSALLFATAMLASVTASAIPTTLYEPGVAVSSEGEEWSTNGVIWSLSGTATPLVDNTGTFTITADVSGWNIGSTGYLSAFSLKNFLTDPVELTNLAGPGTWDVTAAGISGNGCKDPNSDPDAVCLTNTGGAPTTNDGIFSFTFDITTPDPFPEALHFKVYWVDASGDKLGDLISQDMTYVPEPTMVALLAMGLVGIAVAGRRQTRI